MSDAKPDGHMEFMGVEIPYMNELPGGIMKIGFTGTQDGMTLSQQKRFLSILNSYMKHEGADEFHHGDCIGADKQAHLLAMVREMPWIVIHPPDNDSKRANCAGDEVMDPKPYLERNHNIVDAVDILIACPKSHTGEVRSGTWATMRYAEKTSTPILVIYPDGMYYRWPQEEGSK